MLTSRSGNAWSPYQKHAWQVSTQTCLRERGVGPTRKIRSRVQRNLCTTATASKRLTTYLLNHSYYACRLLRVVDSAMLSSCNANKPYCTMSRSLAFIGHRLVRDAINVMPLHNCTEAPGSFLSVALFAGLTTNGVAHNPSLNGLSGVSSTVVDPELLQVLQKVASGGVQPEAAARHLRELGAGYQQVMDFAQVHWSPRAYQYNPVYYLHAASEPLDLIRRLCCSILSGTITAQPGQLHTEPCQGLLQ